jgi:hypothetical protein
MTLIPTATLLPGTDLIFEDGFESGSLTAWSVAVTDGGDLSVSTTAALIGSHGLQAVLDDAFPITLTDESPTAEARYRARFYFDPNSIAMGNLESHTIFLGISNTTNILRVELRYSNGAYQLQARVIRDNNTWLNSPWLAISDSSHYVELDWRAATNSGASDGGLTFWIDGVQRVAITGVDNDMRRLDRIQLGALTPLPSGTRGTYYFDDFVSQRQSYIGPVGN